VSQQLRNAETTAGDDRHVSSQPRGVGHSSRRGHVIPALSARDWVERRLPWQPAGEHDMIRHLTTATTEETKIDCAKIK